MRRVRSAVAVVFLATMATWWGTVAGGSAASAATLAFNPAMTGTPAIEPNPRDLAYPVPATGRVFWVAGEGSPGPGGSDTAAGTQAAPFATLGRALGAARQARSQDRTVPVAIVMRGGTYREGGPAGESNGTYNIDFRVTIQPFEREKVWLDGSRRVTGWRQEAGAWVHDGWTTELCRHAPQPNVRDAFCKHPALVNPSYPMAGAQDMVFYNGSPLVQVAGPAEVRPGTFAVDHAADRLWIGSDPLAAGAVVEASVNDVALRVAGWGNPDRDGSGTVIQGLGFRRYASQQLASLSPVKAGAVILDNVSDAVLANNTITASATNGLLAVNAVRAAIRNNVLVHNGYVGANIHLSGGLHLTGNWVHGNNTEGLHDSGGGAASAAGIKITRTGPLTVADNVFAHNDGRGLWCDLNCADATIVRNIARHNTRDGIFYEVSVRGLIASNVLHHNDRSGLAVIGSSSVRIYNNTLYGNRDRRQWGGRSAGADLLLADENRCDTGPCEEGWRLRDITVRNNLIGNTQAARLVNAATTVTGPEQVPSDESIVAMDHNGYHRTSASVPATLAGWHHATPPPGDTGDAHHDHPTLASLRTHAGVEAHGIAFDQAADPFFADAAAGDFSLRTDSPARGTGSPLPADVAAAIGLVDVPAAPDRGALVWPTVQVRYPAHGIAIGAGGTFLMASVPNTAGVTHVEYRINRPGSAETTLVAVNAPDYWDKGWLAYWNGLSPAVPNGEYELRAHVVGVVDGQTTKAVSPPIAIRVAMP